MMMPQVFMGICSLAKQIQSSFDKSLHCHEIRRRYSCGCKYLSKVLSARHAVVVVVFMSSLIIFKCAFVICLWSLTVDICYVSRTGSRSCELFAMRSGNRLIFFGCIVTKSFNKVNISEKNLQC